MGGRIIGVKVLEVGDYGRRVKVTELHSTKGWRAPYWMVMRGFWKRPVVGAYYPSNQKAEPILADGSRLTNRTLVAVRDPQGSTRHLQRHGWYRRQLRKEADARATM